MMSATETALSANRELVLTRVFDAPRALVFKAWTDPTLMARWWGPHHFTNPVCELDVRPGGAIHLVMRGPDGRDHPMGGTFHEIAPPERLVFTGTVDDANGKRLLEVHNTVTFAEQGGKTTLTLRAVVVKAAPESAPMLAGMEAGWTQSLERLGQLVSGR